MCKSYRVRFAVRGSRFAVRGAPGVDAEPRTANREPRTVLLIGVWLTLLASMGQTRAVDPLLAARDLYNRGQYEEAIAAATEARSGPGANAAAVVLARAHLERYRLTAQTANLDGAEAALKAVNENALAPGDHVDFLVGLGVAVYLDERDALQDRYSAAAELFGAALARSDGVVAPAARERILEWWCGALDRQAQFGPVASRPAIYARMLGRVEAELARDDRSVVALYWRVAAARGAGDLDRAWGAAVAGWLRARYFGERGAPLRADQDRFVTEVLLPDRAERLTPDADPRPTLALLEEGWRAFKERWSAGSSDPAMPRVCRPGAPVAG